MQIPIIVINLDRDVARMAHMETQLRKLGLSFTRFAAIRGDALPACLQPYFPEATPLKAGEIGCYASHLMIMKRLADAQVSSPVLVLEDDVALPGDLAHALRAIQHALPSDWDIVRLSNATKRVTRLIAPLGNRDLVRYSHVPVSTGAYLISASGARKFLKVCARRLPIDQDLRRIWAWDLDTYGVTPELIRADVLGSSSIDAMSSRTVDAAANANARRRRRLIESPLRFLRGAKDFGLVRWCAAEALNLAARLTPRRARPALFEWSKRRLA